MLTAPQIGVISCIFLVKLPWKRNFLKIQGDVYKIIDVGMTDLFLLFK